MFQGSVMHSVAREHHRLWLVPARARTEKTSVPSVARPVPGMVGPAPAGQKLKLLDRVREAIRTRHYSLRTEETSVHWIKRFILFHGKRHPGAMGAQEIALFNRAAG